MTTIYTVHVPNGWHDKVINNRAEAGDDLAKVKWFKMSELKGKVITAHQRGIDIFTKHPYFQLLQQSLKIEKIA